MMHIPTTEDIQYHKLNDVDITIAYREVGSGDDILLFIHGLGNSLIGWEMNTRPLSEYYRCVALDLPGNGFSSRDGYPYGIDFFAHSVAAFIKENGWSGVTLAGHSMGGQVSLRMAYLFPDLVRKLVLIAPAGIEQFSQFEKTIMTAGMNFFDIGLSNQHKLRQALLASFYRLDSNAYGLIEEMLFLADRQPAVAYKKMIDQCIQSMLDHPSHPYLHLIEQQVLMIFGDKDAMIPNKIFHPYSTASMARKGIRHFQDAQLMLIPNGGHFVHWEKAADVNAAIRDFMK